MRVRISSAKGERFIKVPVWHYEQFTRNPDLYLRPILLVMGPDAEWEIVRGVD